MKIKIVFLNLIDNENKQTKKLKENVSMSTLYYIAHNTSRLPVCFNLPTNTTLANIIHTTYQESYFVVHTVQ